MKTNKLYSLRDESFKLREIPLRLKKRNFGLLKYIENKILSLPFWGIIFSKYTKHINFNEYTMNFEKLPKEFSGFKILFISDLHLDIIPNPINEFLNVDLPDYDIVILGGDYFDCPKNPNMEMMKLFIGKIDKPIFAIMGNHDNLDVLEHMEKMGVCFLLNETIEIVKGKESILLSGIEETVFRDSEYQKKVMDDSLSRDCAFKILLSHSPDTLVDANSYNYDLQLSGHTHGGQVLLFNKAIYRNTKYDFALSGGWMYLNLQGYTSSGFGSSGFPVRNIFPEVCLLTLNRYCL